MRTTHRRSFVVLATTATLTTLAGCASGAAATPAGGASTPTASAGGTSAGTYRDGTYSATGDYRSPGGEQKVQVKVTLADDVVTAVEVTPEPSDPTSQSYQQRFASGVAEQVVGKRLDEVHVDRVSGSSLTSQGFAAALAQIATDARG